MFRVTSLIGLLLISQAAFSSMVDYPDGHPLVPPYEGSTAWWTESYEFFEAKFPMAAVPMDFTKGEYLAVSGSAYAYEYSTPEGSSMASVTESYKQALEDAGMELLFSCSGSDCGPGLSKLFSETNKTSGIPHEYSGNDPVWLYRLSRDTGNVYVFLHFETGKQGPKIYQTVLEEGDKPIR
ncbi:hypothetical protein BTA51_11435 [Hahella sp. CCB-MM4]|uniref:hypothetical protein n=1 Tax=Hahella sp. (strain CCB-MM4) TaxID=1926491 RepID=UPI000B9B5970|nr:hypothetical protein [Hahella sp. CCB-MM4]OZG73102.1 hypothetical protein BTA51_11435 [Hahella sp. CCB-MM4]